MLTTCEETSLFRADAELRSGLDHLRNAPKDKGTLEMIVVRTGSDERSTPSECLLTLSGGVEGDYWAKGCWKSLPDGSPHPDVQVTLMNSRCTQLVAGSRDRWPLAGDNLLVDFDISTANIQPGQRLMIGDVILEVTEGLHTGCGAFVARYGRDAMLFVNSPEGKTLRLRGMYARVVQDGTVRVGDRVRKI